MLLELLLAQSLVVVAQRTQHQLNIPAERKRCGAEVFLNIVILLA